MYASKSTSRGSSPSTSARVDFAPAPDLSLGHAARDGQFDAGLAHRVRHVRLARHRHGDLERLDSVEPETGPFVPEAPHVHVVPGLRRIAPLELRVPGVEGVVASQPPPRREVVDHHHPARRQHAGEIRKEQFEVHVVQRTGRRHDVEGAGRKGQALRLRRHERCPGRHRVPVRQHGNDWLEAGDAPRERRKRRRRETGAAPDVERARRPAASMTQVVADPA